MALYTIGYLARRVIEGAKIRMEERDRDPRAPASGSQGGDDHVRNATIHALPGVHTSRRLPGEAPNASVATRYPGRRLVVRKPIPARWMISAGLPPALHR